MNNPIRVTILEGGTECRKLYPEHLWALTPSPKKRKEIEASLRTFEISFSANQEFIMKQSSFTPYEPGTIHTAIEVGDGKCKIID